MSVSGRATRPHSSISRPKEGSITDPAAHPGMYGACPQEHPWLIRQRC